jgi:exopolyphosphatase/guanosine-5'-triphosphate,3'-diphosphate pyrophosphatase
MTAAVPRFLAIDIGSNAVRLKTWRLPPGGPPEADDFQRHPIRLGTSVFGEGALDDAVADRLVDLLREGRRRLDDGRLVAVRAVATSALREARNRESFRRRCIEEAGIDVRVPTGKEEARLMALGALGRQARPDRSHLLLDIGGGSSEIIRTIGLQVRQARSLPLGAVRLRRRCWPDADPPSPDQRRLAEQTIEQALDAAGGLEPAAPQTDAIGLAGTIVTLHRMLMRAGRIADGSMDLARQQVVELTERLAAMPAAAIAAAYAIEPDRADVILGGALILLALLRRLGLDRLRVVPGGVADGLLEEYLMEMRNTKLGTRKE